jgi:hypothetical protein
METDMVTIMGEIAAMNPIIMGVCNEPVCYYCGLTQQNGLPADHRETCAWQRMNTLMAAMRDEPQERTSDDSN